MTKKAAQSPFNNTPTNESCKCSKSEAARIAEYPAFLAEDFMTSMKAAGPVSIAKLAKFPVLEIVYVNARQVQWSLSGILKLKYT
jgi:hypothetical protein